MGPEVTEDDLMTALRTFLAGLALTGVDPDDIIQSQVNRVPEPKAADFIVMTPTFRRRIATNVETWSTAPDPAPPPDELRMERDTEVTIQLDIHGPNGADNAQTIATLWRSDYGCRAIDPPIFQPLYASDGHQAPFVNAEKQYENRWVMALLMQANVAVSTATDFADSISVEIIGTGA
jgi:hypothetical protein